MYPMWDINSSTNGSSSILNLMRDSLQLAPVCYFLHFTLCELFLLGKEFKKERKNFEACPLNQVITFL